MTATAETIARAVEDLKCLQECPGTPWERKSHEHADLILCRVLTELGAQEVVDEWKRVKKWYS